MKIYILGENNEFLFNILEREHDIVQSEKEADLIIFYSKLFSSSELQKMPWGLKPVIVIADTFSYSTMRILQNKSVRITVPSNVLVVLKEMQTYFTSAPQKKEKEHLEPKKPPVMSEPKKMPVKKLETLAEKIRAVTATETPYRVLVSEPSKGRGTLKVYPEKKQSVPIIDSSPASLKRETASKTEPHFVSKESPQIDNRGITAVFSTAGGVGKTFISTNIAAYAATTGVKTLLVEMDLGYGDDVSALFLTERAMEIPHPTVSTWKNFASPETMMLKTEYGLYLLPRPEMGQEEITFGSEDTKTLLSWASKTYDLVVIDFGVSPYVPYAKMALELSGSVFLIAEPSSKCANKLVSFLKSVAVPLRVVPRSSLIINRYEPTSYYKPHEMARLLEFKNYVTVPEDPVNVNAAMRKGIPVSLFKKGKAYESLKNLTETIVLRKGIGMNEDEPRKKKGLLGKLFGKEKGVDAAL